RRAWADADHFSLERFQGEMLTDGWQAKHEEYATFIRGKHRCPGRHFAKQELLVMLEAFIRHYHVELAEGMPSEPVGLKFSITLQPETPIQVCVRQR
ncbi:MAG: cytochrome P450, partial [Chlamydiia bacterium]|nr:cytochrome P450 [Chlamydiia bacterium]